MRNESGYSISSANLIVCHRAEWHLPPARADRRVSRTMLCSAIGIILR